MSSPESSDLTTQSAAYMERVADIEWLTSITGILKIAQFTVNIIVYIIASVWSELYWYEEGAYVRFVAIFATIFTTILYTLYMFYIVEELDRRVCDRRFPFAMWEMVYNGIVTVFYFAAGIVSAVNGSAESAIAANAFFCFVGFIIYAGDTLCAFRLWRGLALPKSDSYGNNNFGPGTYPGQTNNVTMPNIIQTPETTGIHTPTRAQVLLERGQAAISSAHALDAQQNGISAPQGFDPSEYGYDIDHKKEEQPSNIRGPSVGYDAYGARTGAPAGGVPTMVIKADDIDITDSNC